MPCITLIGSLRPRSALTAHLAINYTSASPASSVASAAGGSAAPGSDAGTGFLAALIDQLLAGSAAGLSTTSTTSATGAATTTVPATAASPTTISDPGTTSLASILSAALPATSDGSTQAPQAAPLLATLSRQLQALKDQLDTGQTPKPDDLKKLGDTLDALAALLALPQPIANIAVQAPSVAGTGAVDAIGNTPASALNLPTAPRSLTLPTVPPMPSPGVAAPPGGLSSSASGAGTGTDQAPATSGAGIVQPTDTSSTASATAATATDPQTAPTTDAQGQTATAATPIAAAPQPTQPATLASDVTALTALASKLEDLSQSLAGTAPQLSRKLDKLSQAVSASAASPQAVTRLDQQVAAAGTTLADVLKPLLPASVTPTDRSMASTATLATTQPQLASANSSLPLPTAPGPDGKPVPQPATTAATNQNDNTSPTTRLSVSPSTVTKAVADPSPVPKSAPSPADGQAASQSDNTTSTPASVPDPSSAASSVAITTTTTTDAAAKPLPAAYQSAQSPVNMAQVAFEMMRQVQQGTSRFTIRLDPPELGRVDVKMHVDPTGTVNARLTVDRVETLDMFQRDRGTLERALSQAGVDGSKTNLEFSLRQNPFAGMAGGNQQQASTAGTGAAFSLSPGEDDTPVASAVTLYRGVATSGGVNLVV